MEDVTVSGSAATHGGGVYAEGCDLSLQGATLTDNTAELGGGLYILGGDVVSLADVVVQGNTASGEDTAQGGGAWIREVTLLDVRDSLFLSNRVVFDSDGTDGGSSGGLRLSQVEDGLLDRVRIDGNVVEALASEVGASSYGGGAEIIYSTVRIRSAHIESNRLGQGSSTWPQGGGLFVYISDVVIEDSSLVSNDAANGWGGGLSLSLIHI